jgi:hypothetical protein
VRRRLGRALPAALAIALLAGAVVAQVGGGFDLSWNTVDGGGATFSTGGGFAVGGTAGQPDAGQHTGGPFGLVGGFWGVGQRAVAAATPTPTPTAVGTLAPTATPTPPAAVEENEDKPRKLTEEQRRQKERSNAGSEEDERVEGNVIAVHCDRTPPEIVIVNRDGEVTLRLVRGAASLCQSARPGMYLTSDNAEKHHEQLYDVFDFSAKGG